MKWMAAVFLFGLCSLGVARSVLPRAPDSEPQQLTGTWKLTAFEDRPADGPAKYPYGHAPTGLLIYDSTGHMSIQIMKVPHPKVASGNEDKVTDKEKLALFDAYEAYFGTYQVD